VHYAPKRHGHVQASNTANTPQESSNTAITQQESGNANTQQESGKTVNTPQETVNTAKEKTCALTLNVSPATKGASSYNVNGRLTCGGSGVSGASIAFTANG
jgi:hypothetical protein